MEQHEGDERQDKRHMTRNRQQALQKYARESCGAFLEAELHSNGNLTEGIDDFTSDEEERDYIYQRMMDWARYLLA